MMGWLRKCIDEFKKAFEEQPTYDPFPFDPKRMLEERTEKLDALWHSPPHCGRFVYTRPFDHWTYEPANCVFIMDSRALLPVAHRRVRSHTFSLFNHEKALYNWLSRADYTSMDCTEVPRDWDRVDYLIYDAINSQVGEAYCFECGCLHAASDLVSGEDIPVKSWSFYTLLCPDQHVLLRSKGIHFNIGSNSERRQG